MSKEKLQQRAGKVGSVQKFLTIKCKATAKNTTAEAGYEYELSPTHAYNMKQKGFVTIEKENEAILKEAIEAIEKGDAMPKIGTAGAGLKKKADQKSE